MPKLEQPVKNVKYTPQTYERELYNAFQRQEMEVASELYGGGPGISAANHIFLRGEDGKFQAFTYVDDEDMIKYALANSLYVVDKNGAMRQIGLEREGGNINITVSVPVTDIDLPPSPGIWTHIKSWFGNAEAKAQIKAYNEAKEFNAAFDVVAKNPAYKIKRNPGNAPVQAENHEEQNEIANDQPQVNQNMMNLPEEVRFMMEPNEPNPSQMNPEEFYAHLDAMDKRGSAIKMFTVATEGNTQLFYKSLAHLLEGQVARNMKAEADKRTDPVEKNAFLDAQKRNYTSMIAGLRNHIAEEVDREMIDDHYTNAKNISVMTKAKDLEGYGVKEYLDSVNAKNAENKQELEQSQPQQQMQNQLQVEQGAAQIQQNQPAPQVMGGHGGLG